MGATPMRRGFVFAPLRLPPGAEGERFGTKAAWRGAGLDRRRLPAPFCSGAKMRFALAVFFLQKKRMRRNEKARVF